MSHYPVNVKQGDGVSRTGHLKFPASWANPVPLDKLPKGDDTMTFGLSTCVSADMLIHASFNVGAYPLGVSYLGARTWDWVIPGERAIITPHSQHFSKTTQQQLRKANWRLTFNRDFASVLDQCAHITRKPQEYDEDEEGDEIEWLDNETMRAFTHAHEQEHAYSIEVWNDEGRLVGGLFGLHFTDYMTVESMFTIESGASKAALLLLCDWAWHWEKTFIDMQEWSPHLGTLGASKFSAKEYQQHRTFHVAYFSMETVSDLEYRSADLVSGVQLTHNTR